MSKKIVFNVKLKCSDTMEMIAGLVHTASRVVDKLDEDARKEILVKLVVHAISRIPALTERWTLWHCSRIAGCIWGWRLRSV